MLLIGNLDAEARMAGLELPLRVRRAISAAATLLAALADEGDALWTPEPVDPARVPAIPGVPRVALCSGVLDADHDARWWCRTDELGRRVNHRGFALALQRSLGIAHRGAAMIADLAQLDDHLATLRPAGWWVLKAPLSASGRERLRHRGPVLDGERRVYAARLLARSDACLFEPWVDRTADLGATDRGVHRLDVDPAGVFRGIELGRPLPDADALTATHRSVCTALAAAGYHGPAGIDAYRWRDDDGSERLHAISEINARLTFGHLARALAERVLPALGIAPTPVVLRIATADPRRPQPPTAGARIVPLLEPGPDDATRAWLELAPR